MSKEEYTKLLEAIEKKDKEIESHPEKAKELLVEAGICTKSGNLTKPYKEK